MNFCLRILPLIYPLPFPNISSEIKGRTETSIRLEDPPWELCLSPLFLLRKVCLLDSSFFLIVNNF